MQSVVFLFLLALGVVYLLFSGSVRVACDESGFDINVSGCFDNEVLYSDIESIEYVEQFEVGNRDQGVGSFKINAGGFSNKQFGCYGLYPNAQ